jgi:acetolactate decarboxylase
VKIQKLFFQLVLPALAGALGLCGCATHRTADAGGSVVTQFSTYDALGHGLYDGGMTLGALLGDGDFGLGTLHGWNGEVVILGGKVYLIDGTGRVSEVRDTTTTTPFLELTHFHAGLERALAADTTYTNLQQSPLNYLPTANAIFPVKISGTFHYVKTRSMPPQSKPYKRMAELVKTQPTFEFRDVRGTMVGFWSPPSMRGVSLAGWHLHFLTDDHQGGGHVLAFTTQDAAMTMDECRQFHWLIPDTDDYRREDFAKP